MSPASARAKVIIECDGPKCNTDVCKNKVEFWDNEPDTTPDELYRVITITVGPDAQTKAVFLSKKCASNYIRDLNLPLSPREKSKIDLNNEKIDLQKQDKSGIIMPSAKEVTAVINSANKG